MRFRLTDPAGQVLEEGEGRAFVEGGAIVVSPTLGQPIRIKPTDIMEVSEPAPYVVRLRLREGPVLDLSQLGAARTQLLAEIGDVRREDTVSSLLLAAVGRPETFSGALNEIESEVRLYDDALVVIPATGPPEQVPYSFIEAVDTDESGYRITVQTGEGQALEIHRMAQRTSEFLELLRRRVTAARGRTSAFLGALLPGLGSLALRSVAGLLRDGLAASKLDLDAIDPSVWPALVEASTIPPRMPCLEALARLGAPGIGFKQVASVERPAEGLSQWQDSSAAPRIGEHGGDQGTYAPGIGGAAQAGMGVGIARSLPGGLGFDAPFGQFGTVLALGMLGNMGGGRGLLPGIGGAPGPASHEPKGRPDMTRGTLAPESTDVSALGVSGGEPTILAFALTHTDGGKLVYEVLNEPDHATYVYSCTKDQVRAINRALVLIGFRVEAIYSDASGAGSRYKTAVESLPYLAALRNAFSGRAMHTEVWESQLRGLL